MKKAIKIILTLSFIPLLAFAIYQLVVNFSDQGLGFIVLAFAFFAMHLFAWIAPKKCFDLCWKMLERFPNGDTYDYDTSFRKLESCDIGILIVANLVVCISLIFVCK